MNNRVVNSRIERRKSLELAKRHAARTPEPPLKIELPSGENGAHAMHYVIGSGNESRIHKLAANIVVGIGALAVVGVVSAVGVIGIKRLLASDSKGDTCTAFKPTAVEPSADKPDNVIIASSLKFPSATAGQPDIPGLLKYNLSTNVHEKTLPGSCALMVTVEAEVDPDLFKQTQAMADLKSPDLPMSYIFSTFNANIDDTTLDMDTRLANYKACLGQISLVMSAVGGQSDAFAAPHFSTTFLAATKDVNGAKVPHTRYDYAPYSLDTAAPAIPDTPYREVRFVDKNQGRIGCDRVA